MNETTLPVPAVPEPPDVITWQLNNAAKLGQAASGLARQIDAHDARITELRAKSDEVKARAEKELTSLANTIADLKASREELMAKEAKEHHERSIALRMIELWWLEAHGPDVPLPPIPTEVPADVTGPFPVAEVCCECGSTDVEYHNYKKRPFCWPCADGRGPNAQPQPGDATEAIPAVRLGFRDHSLPADALGLENGAVYTDRRGIAWQWFGEWVISLDHDRQVPMLHNQGGFMKADTLIDEHGPLIPAPDVELLATVCTACLLPMARETGESSWVHTGSSLLACEPAEVSDAPVATPAHDGKAAE